MKNAYKRCLVVFNFNSLITPCIGNPFLLHVFNFTEPRVLVSMQSTTDMKQVFKYPRHFKSVGTL